MGDVIDLEVGRLVWRRRHVQVYDIRRLSHFVHRTALVFPVIVRRHAENGQRRLGN